MKRPFVLADDKIPFLRGALEALAEVSYLPGGAISPSDVYASDALLTRTRTRCDASLLADSRVRLIATATIGFDHIDTAWCEARGIRWVNAPGCNAASVQQYLTAAILEWVRRKGLRLGDTTLGIVGLGHVGSRVAAAGRALGLRVLGNDPPRSEREGTEGFTPLVDLLEASDIVSCHTPLTRRGPYATFHLASEAFFARMKQGALFINTSRGAVVDSEALRSALETRLSGCILDVWEGEPATDPVLREKAFLATPHIAGYSADGKANGTAACVREVMDFFRLEGDAAWYPANIPPPPMAQYLEIDNRGKTPEAVFYEAVTHAYPIGEDSRRLKEAPGAFERLREGYGVRREFPCFTLRLREAEPVVEAGLRKLGFNVIETLK
ncbi:MAG: 4-phosphoerythronate dehydrogenase [Tannerellaceae bacterium]|jgi:erythronate-4-phosphate dehydrogenase|nr:4-phosphoerythronate dehydrogenase [Tannerellaceae bacterium]